MSRPELSEVLAEVNRLRAARGLEPLSEMPKGVQLHSSACPVACALRNGSAVHVRPYRTSGGFFCVDGEEAHDLPVLLGHFARAFDQGLYPELVA